MTNVSKRDGRTEEFMPEKIVVSAVKSGASPAAAREIAGEVQQNARGTVSTQEIRSRVLEGLESRNPDWRRNWEVYDLAVKRRG
ncbi:MAG: ATP cone domain-containing protein [Methanospirillum sp.]